MTSNSQTDHQFNHDHLHFALNVKIQDGEYIDVEPYVQNLYRGSHYGEGHSDRLLDDYQCRKKLGAELKDTCNCPQYEAHLRNERMYGVVAPPLSTKARLMRNA
jgi:hypothetical protein